MRLNEPLPLLFAERSELLSGHVQLTNEHRHHPSLVLDRPGFQLDWARDRALCPNALPELLARDLELMAKHATDKSPRPPSTPRAPPAGAWDRPQAPRKAVAERAPSRAERMIPTTWT
jgi:hypothetical protein